MIYLENCTALIEDYDGFIVDLWGVVHDGARLYDGIIDVLATIHKQNKPLIFLSNAPRRQDYSLVRLRELGVKDIFYRSIITSGETTLHYAEAHYAGQGLYYLGPESDEPWGEKQQMLRDSSLNYTNLARASAILCIGHHYDNQPMSELQPILAEAKTLNLPLLCANPDRFIITRDGWECRCAGDIADAYEALGGEVRYFGKPYPRVYENALEQLALPANRILAVGDNPDTDIAGAAAMGIDSLLLTQGVLSNILRHASQSLVVDYIREKNIPATYVAESFRVL
jgi:HAD superfamily hydrolase (TIGR01459 family)